MLLGGQSQQVDGPLIFTFKQLLVKYNPEDCIMPHATLRFQTNEHSWSHELAEILSEKENRGIRETWSKVQSTKTTRVSTD